MLDPENTAREPLVEALSDHGFLPLVVNSCVHAREILASQSITFAIIEHHLPGEDALQLLREISDKHAIPCLMLSAKSKPIHRILALEMGADDFIAKPCDPEEVLARVRAILRRSQPRGISSRTINGFEESQDNVFVFDGLAFDLGRRELRDARGELVDLTSAEIDLLGTFVKNPQTPLTRLKIIALMGKQGDPNSVRTIDVLISKLRRKVKSSAEQPELIKTIRGSGYVFTPKSRNW